MLASRIMRPTKYNAAKSAVGEIIADLIELKILSTKTIEKRITTGSILTTTTSSLWCCVMLQDDHQSLSEFDVIPLA